MPTPLIKTLKNVALVATVMLYSSFSFASESAHSEETEFDAGKMIMHHIADAHSIHLWIPFAGEVNVPLPVIVYSDTGLDVFSSANFYDHHEAVPYTASSGTTYVLDHEHIYFGDEEGHKIMGEKGEVLGPMDLSITKSVFGMFLILALMVWLFIKVANRYKKTAGGAPKGAQSLLEPLILFIRDEVAVPSIGAKKADKFMPFLLSVFFFIWMCNLLGLIPFIGGFNITGTIAVTAVLAALVFIVTTINGNGHYWGHILWPPGVPIPIKFILVPIEIAGVFIKPLVLMVRLTANITAGHIIILAFVSLVIMFGQSSMVAGYGVGLGAIVFMVLMFFIELLVAFLQAYVFTLLAALYFGDATQDGHH